MASNNDAQRVSGTVPVLVVGKGSLVSTNIFEEEAGSVCKTNKPPGVSNNPLLPDSHMSLTGHPWLQPKAFRHSFAPM